MSQYIKSESMKTKHTKIRKMTVLIPLLCVLVAGGFCALGGADVLKLADVTAINHWGLIWLPALVSIMAGLLHNLEMKSTGYKTIVGFPIDIGKVWLAKNSIIAVYTLGASLFLWLLLCLFSSQILFRCLFALLVSWFTILWQIPLYLYLSQKINYFILVLLNCGLSIIIAPVFAPKTTWWAVPWAWTLRMQAPIIHLHPNGIPLESSSELLSYSGYFAVMIASLILLLVTTIVTTRFFEKSEVH